MAKLEQIGDSENGNEGLYFQLGTLGILLAMVVTILGIKLKWFKHRLSFDPVPKTQISGVENLKYNRDSLKQSQLLQTPGVFRWRSEDENDIERPASLPPVRIKKTSKGLPPPLLLQKRSVVPMPPGQELIPETPQVEEQGSPIFIPRRTRSRLQPKSLNPQPEVRPTSQFLQPEVPKRSKKLRPKSFDVSLLITESTPNEPRIHSFKDQEENSLDYGTQVQQKPILKFNDIESVLKESADKFNGSQEENQVEIFRAEDCDKDAGKGNKSNDEDKLRKDESFSEEESENSNTIALNNFIEKEGEKLNILQEATAPRRHKRGRRIHKYIRRDTDHEKTAISENFQCGNSRRHVDFDTSENRLSKEEIDKTIVISTEEEEDVLEKKEILNIDVCIASENSGLEENTNQSPLYRKPVVVAVKERPAFSYVSNVETSTRPVPLRRSSIRVAPNIPLTSNDLPPVTPDSSNDTWAAIQIHRKLTKELKSELMGITLKKSVDTAAPTGSKNQQQLTDTEHPIT